MTNFISKYAHALSGCLRLTKVATLYFRNYAKTSAAKKLFIATIEEDSDMHAELISVGYSHNNQIITPKQITVIIQYWGYPDDFSKLQDSNIPNTRNVNS